MFGQRSMQKANPIKQHLRKELAYMRKEVPDVFQHGNVADSLMMLKFKDGHIHTHSTDTTVAKEFAKNIASQYSIVTKPTKKVDKTRKRKIILRQGQSPGDVLTFTRALGDLKQTYPHWEIDVRTPCPEIFENSPHITPLKENDPGVEIFTITYDNEAGGIDQCGWMGLHFTEGFRIDMEQKLGCEITSTGYKPELWLSDEEQGWINQVEWEFNWKGPFWLLNAGRKQDNELKQYHRWQEVVDLLNEYFKGRVKIVQVGHKDHIHPPLTGVLSLVGKTDMRQLIRLAYWAHGSIGPLSFQFVISAALQQSHVVLAAGKEDVRWHIYPHGQFIYRNGQLNCCSWGGCWLGGNMGQCKDMVNLNGHGKVPRCFELIKPYQVADAVIGFYEGGKLGWGRGK